jgi:hypothetical protein
MSVETAFKRDATIVLDSLKGMILSLERLAVYSNPLPKDLSCQRNPVRTAAVHNLFGPYQGQGRADTNEIIYILFQKEFGKFLNSFTRKVVPYGFELLWL